MAYEGYEIEMLPLGDADCILLTEWVPGQKQEKYFTLIDGGLKRNYPYIRDFLKAHEVKTIQNLVSSHPDVDHVNGLVALVEEEQFTIEHAWVHDPAQHTDIAETQRTLEKVAAEGNRAFYKLASLRASAALLTALQARPTITLHEPFSDDDSYIGSLTVCGPTREYYREQLRRFRDRDAFWSDEEAIKRADCSIDYQKIAGCLLPQNPPPPSPENSTSLVCKLRYGRQTLLFTGDASVEAINQAVQYGRIEHCQWMQIPHHGSRKNMSQEIVDMLRPGKAFVSADGIKHPASEVVAAFHACSCSVFSTHRSTIPLWHSVGHVPDRPEYANMAPLPSGWNGEEGP